MGMSGWCLPENVTAIKPEMHILSTLPCLRYTYPRKPVLEHLPHYRRQQYSQPLTAVSNALYHLRLGAPILTSVQATANFLTLLVAPTNLASRAVCDAGDDGNDGEKVRILLCITPNTTKYSARNGFLHLLSHRGFHTTKESCN